QRGGGVAASPHVGPTTHNQAMAKAPCKGATGYGQGQLEREASSARKGRQPPTGATARRGGAYEQKCHMRARPSTKSLYEWQQPTGTAACSTTLAKGVGSTSHRGGRPLLASLCFSRLLSGLRACDYL
ncbi:hypothetical protein GW17_00058462, partial [Ensete ventricosum]